MALDPVSVVVTETVTASSKIIQVQVSQDPIDLTGQGNGAVQIQWNIRSTAARGWSFSEIGVNSNKFTNTGAGNGPGNSNRLYTLTRLAGQADPLPTPTNPSIPSYKYSISVTDGTQTVILDPSIINQP